MRSARTRASASWAGALAGLATAVAAVLLVPSGCSTLPIEACGDEAATDVCGRLQYECGTVALCYSCGAAKRFNCGSCAKTQTCGGGGVPHVCWPPLVDGGDGGGEDAGPGEGGSTTAEGGGDAGEDGASAADAGDAEADAATDAPVDSVSVDGSADASLDGGTEDGSSPPSEAGSEDASDDGGVTVVLCPDDAFPADDQ